MSLIRVDKSLNGDLIRFSKALNSFIAPREVSTLANASEFDSSTSYFESTRRVYVARGYASIYIGGVGTAL